MNDHLEQLINQAKSKDDREKFKPDLKRKVGESSADIIMHNSEKKLKGLKKIKKR